MSYKDRTTTVFATTGDAGRVGRIERFYAHGYTIYDAVVDLPDGDTERASAPSLIRAHMLLDLLMVAPV